MVDFGKATAGGKTADDPCNGVFDLGFSCGGGDFEVWFAALGTWANFTAALDARAAKLAPFDEWPADVQLQAAAAKAARELYDAGMPWFQWEGTLATWAAAQQDLRNYAGTLATWLETKGVLVPKDSAPADLPPAPPSILMGAVKMLGLLGVGYLAIKLFKEG